MQMGKKLNSAVYPSGNQAVKIRPKGVWSLGWSHLNTLVYYTGLSNRQDLFVHLTYVISMNNLNFRLFMEMVIVGVKKKSLRIQVLFHYIPAFPK